MAVLGMEPLEERRLLSANAGFAIEGSYEPFDHLNHEFEYAPAHFPQAATFAKQSNAQPVKHSLHSYSPHQYTPPIEHTPSSYQAPLYAYSPQHAAPAAYGRPNPHALDRYLSNSHDVVDDLLEVQTNDNGPVVVSSTDAHEQIRIVAADKYGAVRVEVLAFANSRMHYADLIGRSRVLVNAAQGIVFEGRGGDDVINVDAGLTGKLQVSAGAGDDSITLSGVTYQFQSSQRSVLGGDGDDRLHIEQDKFQNPLNPQVAVKYDGGEGVNTISVAADRNFELSASRLTLTQHAFWRNTESLTGAVDLVNVSRAELVGGMSSNTLKLAVNAGEFTSGVSFDGVNQDLARITSQFSDGGQSLGSANLTLDGAGLVTGISIQTELDLGGQTEATQEQVTRDWLAKRNQYGRFDAKIARLDADIDAAKSDDVTQVDIVDSAGNVILNIARQNAHGTLFAAAGFQLDRSAGTISSDSYAARSLLTAEDVQRLAQGELSFRVQYGPGGLMSVDSQIQSQSTVDVNPDSLIVLGKAQSTLLNIDSQDQTSLRLAFDDGTSSLIEFTNTERVEDNVLATHRDFVSTVETRYYGESLRTISLSDDGNFYNGVSRLQVAPLGLTVDFVNGGSNTLTLDGHQDQEISQLEASLAHRLHVVVVPTYHSFYSPNAKFPAYSHSPSGFGTYADQPFGNHQFYGQPNYVVGDHYASALVDPRYESTSLGYSQYSPFNVGNDWGYPNYAF